MAEIQPSRTTELKLHSFLHPATPPAAATPPLLCCLPSLLFLLPLVALTRILVGNLAPTLLLPRVSHLVSAASWDPLAPSSPRCQPPCQPSRQLYKHVSSIPLPLPAFPLAIAIPHLPLLLFLLPFSHSFRPSVLPPALVAAIW
jgi:hypothetical protein